MKLNCLNKFGHSKKTTNLLPSSGASSSSADLNNNISNKCNLRIFEKFVIICKKNLCSLNRQNGRSPIGFSRSGIWLISRPGFGILKEKRDEIQDCHFDRDTGFGDFNRQESGNVALKKPRYGKSFRRLKYANKMKLSS